VATQDHHNPGFVSTLANGSVGPIPAAVIVMAVALLIFWALLRFTYFGRDVYAVGGNPEAAALSGISVARVRIAGFGLLGAAGGTAAVLRQASSALWLPRQRSAWSSPPSPPSSSAAPASRAERARDRTSVAVLFLGSLSNGLDLGHFSFWQNVVTASSSSRQSDSINCVATLARRTRRETT